MAKTLAIIGGGPKAAAIVARASVLRDHKVGVPDILVFERRRVGSAWSGQDGYSSGHLTLCSPAERDVGYPYVEPTDFGAQPAISQELFGRFSWSAFLVDTGRFAEWVDRGRDHPTHAVFAAYLQWVFVQAEAVVTSGEVLRVERVASGRWNIVCQNDAGREFEGEVDGVVLTGAGEARPIALDAAAQTSGRVLDAETFWSRRDEVAAAAEIAVAGAGGAAGAIIAWLAQATAERQTALYAISPLGTLFPRGDGHAERRWFSDPTNWRELTIADRRKILQRTEEGVISERNKRTIDAARNLEHVMGYAKRVRATGTDLTIGIEYDGKPRGSVGADFLINAIGFNPWSLLKCVTGSASLLTEDAAKDRASIEEEILPDLSLPLRAGLGAGLHVPVLSALSRGPAMGTLGALGLMAQSVLSPYIE